MWIEVERDGGVEVDGDGVRMSCVDVWVWVEVELWQDHRGREGLR